MAHNDPMTAPDISKHGETSVCGPGQMDMGWSCVAPNVIVAFLALSVLSMFAGKIAARACAATSQGSVRQKRNVVSYIVGLVVKTVSLMAVLSAGTSLLFLDEPLSDQGMRICMAGGFLMISTFYTWEIVYRVDMDKMLMVHHVCTLTLVVACALGSFDLEREGMLMTLTDGKRSAIVTGRRLVMRITLMELLAAATNQPILVALLLHRAKLSSSRRAFLAAAAWELISKNLRFVFALILYGSGSFTPAINAHCSDLQWCWALRIVYPPLAILIWLANMHMVCVLWSLSKKRTCLDMERTSGANSQVKDDVTKSLEAKYHVDADDCICLKVEAVATDMSRQISGHSFTDMARQVSGCSFVSAISLELQGDQCWPPPNNSADDQSSVNMLAQTADACLRGYLRDRSWPEYMLPFWSVTKFEVSGQDSKGCDICEVELDHVYNRDIEGFNVTWDRHVRVRVLADQMIIETGIKAGSAHYMKGFQLGVSIVKKRMQRLIFVLKPPLIGSMAVALNVAHFELEAVKTNLQAEQVAK